MHGLALPEVSECRCVRVDERYIEAATGLEEPNGLSNGVRIGAVQVEPLGVLSAAGLVVPAT